MPWTVSVRERLPPGSVAVLINRAHPFTDLILTVDAVEDRLLNEIDGKRTPAELLRIAGHGVEERRAKGFFERLWQYDRVVFDASCARRVRVHKLRSVWTLESEQQAVMLGFFPRRRIKMCGTRLTQTSSGLAECFGNVS